MQIFKFSWKELPSPYAPKMFICVAKDRPTAMLLLSSEVPRVTQHFTLDQRGDFHQTTEFGANHLFRVEACNVEDGQVILNNI